MKTTEPRVGEIVETGRELFVASGKSTVAQVLQTLADKEVYSLPVVTKKGQCQGFVDWLDILAHLTIVSSEAKQSRVSPPSRSLTTDDVSTLMQRANEFNLRTVRERRLINKGGHDPFQSVRADDPMSKAVNLLGQSHHIGVLGPAESKILVNVISQMDVIRWLVNDSERTGAIGRKSIKGLKLHRKRVFCVRADDIAIDAFYALWSRGVTGAAVIDREGKLVGNLSASDLKDLGDFTFAALLKPVREWVGDELPTVVHEFDSLNDVLSKMVSGHYHRVYVAAPGGYPQGVITCTDVLSVLKPKKKDKKKKKK